MQMAEHNGRPTRIPRPGVDNGGRASAGRPKGQRVQPFQGMAGEARSAYPLRIIYASERLGSEGFNRCRLDMRGGSTGPLGPLGVIVHVDGSGREKRLGEGLN